MSIPAELKSFRQWMTWNLVDGRKIPNGKSNDPNTWTEFDSVAISDRKAFVFASNDPYTGIDLDSCRDPDGGEIKPWAMAIIRTVNSYTEISPSGTGVKIILRAKKTRQGCVFNMLGEQPTAPGKSPQVEIYDNGRFWCMTGQVLPGFETIRDAQSELDEITNYLISIRDLNKQKHIEAPKQNRNGMSSMDTLRKRVQAYVDKADSPQPGQRNNTAFSLAGNVAAMEQDGQRLAKDEVLEFMRSWNSQLSEPLDATELENVTYSAMTNGTKREAKTDRPITRKNYFEGSGLEYSLISQLVAPDNRTENTLATMFIDVNEAKFRYVREWNRWLFWDGSRWLHDASENLVTREARRFGDMLLDQLGGSLKRLPDDELNKIVSFVRHANGSRGIKNFISLSQSDERISISYKDLNRGKLLFNVKNGTVDLSSGKLREHNQDDLMTQMAEVTYSDSVDCPRWKAAVDIIFGQDPSLVRYVQQLIGYSISGQCGEHILPICYGSGFNGKSFLWNTILRVVGDYGFLANDALLLGEKHSHPTEKAALYQKRFVPISEPDQDSRLRESRVKELTGDSTITARRMHEDFWSFDRSHTFWLASNHLPKIAGTDEGIWRRIKLIPFTVDLRQKVAPIANYDEVLATEEGSGILNWMIGGYLDYQANGLQEPDVVRDATKLYRQDSDEVASFVDEVCLVGPSMMAPANKLFNEFQRWGGKASRTAFGLKMAERFVKDKPNAGEFRKQVLYHGIGLPGSDSN